MGGGPDFTRPGAFFKINGIIGIEIKARVLTYRWSAVDA